MIDFKYCKPDFVFLENRVPINFLKENKFIVTDYLKNTVICYGTIKCENPLEEEIEIQVSDSTFKNLILQYIYHIINNNIECGNIRYYYFIPLLSRNGVLEIRDLNENPIIDYNSGNIYNFYILEKEIQKIDSFIEFYNPEDAIKIEKISINKVKSKHIIYTNKGKIFLGVEIDYSNPILIEEIDYKGNVIKYYYY